MAISRFLLFICGLLFCLSSSVTARRRMNFYEIKYIEDMCHSTEPVHYFLSETGLWSAMKVTALYTSAIRSAKNCTIIIHAPVGYGVILHVDKMHFPKYYDQCLDYLEVFGDGGNSTKLCGTAGSVFLTEENMKLLYFTRNGPLPKAGFTLSVTAYKRDNEKNEIERFMCLTGEYIWSGFQCDGSVNCPDGSDEFKNCFDIDTFTFKPIDIDWNLIYPTTNIMTYRRSFSATISAAVASGVLILLVAMLRFVCHYHCVVSQRRVALRRISVIHARQAPQHFQAPPPPYTSLVNETSNPSGVNPPDYSAAVYTAAAAPAEGNKDLNPNKSNNGAAEPPPPYEP